MNPFCKILLEYWGKLSVIQYVIQGIIEGSSVIRIAENKSYGS